MKKIIKALFIGLVIFLGLGFFAIYKYGPRFNIYLKPPNTKEYVDHALKVMDMGINAGSKDWDQAKESAKSQAKDMETFEDTYELLDQAAKQAGGKHSYFLKPSDVKEGAREVNMPETRLEEETLYIKLPSIMLAENKDMQAYVDRVNEALTKNDFKNVIIDLAGNTGGDMNPMVLSLAPLLKEGELLAFKTGETKTGLDLEGLSKTSGLSYTDKKLAGKKIAVIIDDMTASSGEITGLALKSLEGVKFIGEPSAGYTSVNQSISLYDGAMVVLTTGSIVDKAGNEYLNDKIIPDIDSKNPIEDAKAYS